MLSREQGAESHASMGSGDGARADGADGQAPSFLHEMQRARRSNGWKQASSDSMAPWAHVDHGQLPGWAMPWHSPQCDGCAGERAGSVPCHPSNAELRP